MLEWDLWSEVMEFHLSTRVMSKKALANYQTFLIDLKQKHDLQGDN